MLRKMMIGGLALLFAPLMQSCNDRDVATGAAIGAVVGGSIAAASDGNRSRDRYARSRYNNYYRDRGNYYDRSYRNRYSNRDYSRVSRGYNQRRRNLVPGSSYGENDRNYRGYSVAPLSLVMRSAEARNVSNFFEVPTVVAAIMTDVKNRARHGDLSGVYAIGLDSGDFRDLANDQRLSSRTITIVAASLNIEKRHAYDILEDFRGEFKAQVAAGKIRL